MCHLVRHDNLVKKKLKATFGSKFEMVLTSRRKKELSAQGIPKIKHRIRFDVQHLRAQVEASKTFDLTAEKLNVMSKNSATYFLQVTKAWDHVSLFLRAYIYSLAQKRCHGCLGKV